MISRLSSGCIGSKRFHSFLSISRFLSFQCYLRKTGNKLIKETDQLFQLPLTGCKHTFRHLFSEVALMLLWGWITEKVTSRTPFSVWTLTSISFCFFPSFHPQQPPSISVNALNPSICSSVTLSFSSSSPSLLHSSSTVLTHSIHLWQTDRRVNRSAPPRPTVRTFARVCACRC